MFPSAAPAAISFAVRFYLAGQFTRHDIHTGPLQILPLASHRSTIFFYSLSIPLISPSLFLPSFFFTSYLFAVSCSFSLTRWAHLAIYMLVLLFPYESPYSALLLPLRSFLLSPFRRHVRRAKCTARDAHSPRSSEPRLESGEILIAPIGVRTYFPRRQRRVEAEGPRETR